MPNWSLVDDSVAREKWDSWLKALGEDCLYQSFSWGAHKQQIGQPQTRVALIDDSKQPLLLMQGHLKRMPFGISVLWIPGGPCGNFELLDNNALLEIKKLLNAKHLLLRASIMRPRDAKDVSTLRRLGHSEAQRKINSGLSMALPVPQDGTDPLKNASSNWKHNLRRGQKRTQAQAILNPDAKEIADTYKNLQEVKKIGEQFSESAIAAMINEFGSNLKVLGNRDAEGKLIAMRACICVNGKGWDIWAAATEEARKNYTSHLLLENLLLECQRSGVSHYELSGIDPCRATGVYNFKKGTGAQHVEYLGEWDLGSKKVARLLDAFLFLKATVRKIL